LKQKISTSEVETAFTDAIAISAVEEENSVFSNLSESMVETCKVKGVIGYIVRSNTSAIIDLKEQDKIIEYAALTYQIHDSSQEIAKQLNLGETESTLVEGKNIKVLCMSVGENRISVFMEKSTNHTGIIRRILLH
jgi:predicted regulator of Ras-like GTPase activity (Roadblock/LC7/MglB family)